MFNTIFNKLDRKSLLYLIIVVIVAILVCVGFVCYLLIEKKPPSISDCKDIECVKNYAKNSSFLADDCEKTLPEFKDQCYYTYEIERSPHEKNNPEAGKYCLLVGDKNLKADCLFKTVGGIINPPLNIQDNLTKAINSLNAENCDNINSPQWKEQCLNDLTIIKKAVDKKNMTYCMYELYKLHDSAGPSFYAGRICIGAFPRLLLEKNPSK